jgi:hypothetical protein
MVLIEAVENADDDILGHGALAVNHTTPLRTPAEALKPHRQQNHQSAGEQIHPGGELRAGSVPGG